MGFSQKQNDMPHYPPISDTHTVYKYNPITSSHSMKTSLTVVQQTARSAHHCYSIEMFFFFVANWFSSNHLTLLHGSSEEKNEPPSRTSIRYPGCRSVVVHLSEYPRVELEKFISQAAGCGESRAQQLSGKSLQS